MMSVKQVGRPTRSGGRCDMQPIRITIYHKKAFPLVKCWPYSKIYV